MTFNDYFITITVSMGTCFSHSFSSITSMMYQYSPIFLTQLAQLPMDLSFIKYTSVHFFSYPKMWSMKYNHIYWKTQYFVILKYQIWWICNFHELHLKESTLVKHIPLMKILKILQPNLPQIIGLIPPWNSEWMFTKLYKNMNGVSHIWENSVFF
jgi:hypothetical protein